ncbi:MAG: TatD family hydrolase [Anaerolineaceae bacterium]
MSGYVDTHCHLNFNSFQNDLPQVLERARQACIRAIVIPGTDPTSSQSAVALASLHSDLFAAVGVHPNDTGEWDENTISELRDLAASPKVRAVGEIGLDYYREVTDHARQKEIFLAQLALAGELGLPVVIHNRNSIQDLWPILKEWVKTNPSNRPIHGVLHSFDGSVELAEEAYAAGFFLGISGPVTYSNAQERREVIAKIPLECMLLETDAPFLTPHPNRGKRNEPAYIPIIAAEIARIKQIDITEVQSITSKNSTQLFSLGNLD